jgi:hypothetical protein
MQHRKSTKSRELHLKCRGTTWTVQFGNNDADDGVQSGDDDDDNLENKGPGIGHWGWVGGQWHDPIDPHPIAPREHRSGLEFDPDYILNLVQVMTTRD